MKPDVLVRAWISGWGHPQVPAKGGVRGGHLLDTVSFPSLFTDRFRHKTAWDLVKGSSRSC